MRQKIKDGKHKKKCEPVFFILSEGSGLARIVNEEMAHTFGCIRWETYIPIPKENVLLSLRYSELSRFSEKDKAKRFLNYVRCYLQRDKDKKSPAKSVHREPYFFTNIPVFIVNSI